WICESALHSLAIALRSCVATIHAQRVMAYLNRGIAQGLGRLDSHFSRPGRTRGAIRQIPRWPGRPPAAEHRDVTPRIWARPAISKDGDDGNHETTVSRRLVRAGRSRVCPDTLANAQGEGGRGTDRAGRDGSHSPDS